MAGIVDLLLSPPMLAAVLMFAFGSLAEAMVSRNGFSLADRLTNVQLALGNAAAEFALAGAKLLLIVWLVEAVGMHGLVDLSAIPGPPLVQSLLVIAVSMFVADFFLYWMHRFEHENAWLWAEHAVHHADRHVTVMSAGRLHPLATLLRIALVSMPMAVLFDIPRPELIAFGLLPYTWLYFIHLDVRLGFGPLWWLLTSPQYHLVHHSVEPKHFNRNYAAFCPFWDIVFGTAYRPAANEYPEVGLAGVEIASLREAVAYPIARWRSLLRRRLGSKRPRAGQAP